MDNKFTIICCLFHIMFNHPKARFSISPILNIYVCCGRSPIVQGVCTRGFILYYWNNILASVEKNKYVSDGSLKGKTVSEKNKCKEIRIMVNI